MGYYALPEDFELTRRELEEPLLRLPEHRDVDDAERLVPGHGRFLGRFCCEGMQSYVELASQIYARLGKKVKVRRDLQSF